MASVSRSKLLQFNRCHFTLTRDFYSDASLFHRSFTRLLCSARCPKDAWSQPPPTTHSIPPLCNTKLFSSSSAMASNLSSSSSKLVLYSYWQSSCSWRVRFALNLKGLSYEYRAVNLSKGEQFDPEFEKLNPLGYVPVLVDGGDAVIADSYAILLYLEEKYPKHPLLPLDPQLRAINLQAASIVSSSIQPLHMLSLLKHVEERFGPNEGQTWAKLNIEKGFCALEKLLIRYAGRHATGNRVYLADVFLAPQIAIAAERFHIDMSKFPTLHAIYNSCKELPEFQASSPQNQPDAAL
ncbi:PREDICTED: glutathione S-transferase zeta class-like [Ipomoea nil]|uniref:glutathione S-transferase zeta class-like n=1 Tax=Ipomoea nil TaxID=35883 RepID=UPI000901EAB1|nr:PREDICTED: glutathione S-transferase zeta class-like [Ipomoea nil]XP_019189409.1 PREDICTED: glutathione S-transferase zeta class-like [Ipomoea nil]